MRSHWMKYKLTGTRCSSHHAMATYDRKKAEESSDERTMDIMMLNGNYFKWLIIDFSCIFYNTKYTRTAHTCIQNELRFVRTAGFEPRIMRCLILTLNRGHTIVSFSPRIDRNRVEATEKKSFCAFFSFCLSFHSLHRYLVIVSEAARVSIYLYFRLFFSSFVVFRELMG